MICDERWKSVRGFEGLYEVSNLGEVFTVEHDQEVTRDDGSKYTVHVPSKQKIQALCNTGYYSAALSKDGCTENYLVHRLVAEAFIPNPNNLPCVNHKDGDKTNNCVNNLEWCSYQENGLHAVSCGLNTSAMPVMCIETGEVFPSITQCAKQLDISISKLQNLISSNTTLNNKHYTYEKDIV